MTAVIESNNGCAVVRERDRHVLADGFHTNSAAWRAVIPHSKAWNIKDMMPKARLGKR